MAKEYHRGKLGQEKDIKRKGKGSKERWELKRNGNKHNKGKKGIKEKD